MFAGYRGWGFIVDQLQKTLCFLAWRCQLFSSSKIFSLKVKKALVHSIPDISRRAFWVCLMVNRFQPIKKQTNSKINSVSVKKNKNYREQILYSISWGRGDTMTQKKDFFFFKIHSAILTTNIYFQSLFPNLLGRFNHCNGSFQWWVYS